MLIHISWCLLSTLLPLYNRLLCSRPNAQIKIQNGLSQNISTHPAWTTLEILQEMLNEYDWKSTNFPQILQILSGIPGKPFKFLQNSGIPQHFESAGLWNPAKTAVVLLGNPDVLGTQFCVVHRGAGWIFSGIVQFTSNLADIYSSNTYIYV